MKKTLLTLAAGAGTIVLLASCQSSNVAYPGGEEEAIMMSDATDPGVIPPWATEEDIQVPAGSTTHDRNNYAIPEGPVASNSGTSQNQPEVSSAPSSQNQPPASTTTTSDVVVENDPLVNLTTQDLTAPEPEVRHTGTSSSGKGGKKSGGKQSGGKKSGGKKSGGKRISSAKPSMVTYKVRPGDNLTLIAKRSNTTLDQIRKDSNLKSDVIRPGQIIKVRYTPKDYKAPASSGKKGGAKGGSSSSASKGSSAAKGSVTVKAGDSLSAIAAREGVTVAQLKAANGLSGDTIRSGQKLNIPSKATSSKKAATPTKKKSGSTKKKSSRKR